MSAENSGNLSSPSWTCRLGDAPRIWMNSFDFNKYFPVFFALTISTMVNVIIGVLGNTLLITAILTAPRMNTPSYRLIASQAFCDLLMVLYLLIFFAFLVLGLTGNLHKGCFLWLASVSGASGFSWISILNSLFLSIDRYLAVHLGIRYRGVVTMGRVRCIVLLVWISSPVFPFLPFILLDNPFDSAKYVLILLVFCTFMITLCYIKALKNIKEHMQAVKISLACSAGQQTQESHLKRCETSGNSTKVISSRSHQEPSKPACDKENETSTSKRLDINRYNKSIWTLIIIELVFIVLTLPKICVWGFILMKDRIESRGTVFLAIVLAIWHLVSMVNPIIHILRVNEVRQACLSVLVKLKSYVIAQQ